MDITFKFEISEKQAWITNINSIHEFCADRGHLIDKLTISISDTINKEDLTSLHIVTFACMCSYILRETPNAMRNITANSDVISFLKDDLNILEYFKGSTHIKAKSPNIYNLWKIKHKEAFMYSNNLASFLRQSYFKDKDLSPFQTALDELFSNVADHSFSGGIAYSYVQYNEISKKLDVAFCDFGIGIPTSLKTNGMTATDGYINLATKRNVTVRSNIHNAGQGLANVLESISAKSIIRIVSNDELFIYNGNIRKTLIPSFNFKGTLIYFELDITTLEDEEIVTEQNLWD